MLIYFFTDRNYEIEGFTANYEIQNCPYNCHEHGQCIHNQCKCDTHFVGVDCEQEPCSDCATTGFCLKKSDGTEVCKCNAGYLGVDCEFKITGYSERYNDWYKVSDSTTNFSSRESHSMVFERSKQCLYVFGGFDLNNYLNDLLIYCIKDNYWTPLSKSSPWPSARSQHAMAGVTEGFYIFGGKV